MADKSLPRNGYAELIRKSGDDFEARLKLNALRATLDHFNILENREVMAEAILHFDFYCDTYKKTDDEKINQLAKITIYFQNLPPLLIPYYYHS